MHRFSLQLRRVRILLVVGAFLGMVLPQTAAAAYAWGAVDVQGCTWAPSLPGICKQLDVHSNG
ncbi:MAG TPA: hypothetical protein VGR61_01920, partial [Candidatus Dormibacteraeota bacterium]|nr:hypothetical protein [Candidatus Dormibacteraeota bacterium]